MLTYILFFLFFLHSTAKNKQKMYKIYSNAEVMLACCYIMVASQFTAIKRHLCTFLVHVFMCRCIAFLNMSWKNSSNTCAGRILPEDEEDEQFLMLLQTSTFSLKTSNIEL